MRVAITSDWHWLDPPDIPECDLLLLPGDIFPGSGNGFPEFARWLEEQPATDIIAVAGNHDGYVATGEGRRLAKWLPMHYLENESVEVAGLKVFGSPLSTPFNNWDFMADESKLEEVWATIPDDVDVVVTHGPARGIGDLTRSGVLTGSITLRERLRELHGLRLYAFGHIHESAGVYGLPFAPGAPLNEDGTSTRLGNPWVGPVSGLSYVVCVNSSYVDENYKPTNPVVVVDL